MVHREPLPPETQSVPAEIPDDGNATISDQSLANTSSSILPPCERYELGAEIARGGMGIVHRAFDNVFGREVAIKVLQHKFGTNSSTACRFFDEARITGQLQHPGIPPVHDIGTLADGRPFMAMKLIKGETLEVLLRLRPTPSHDRGRFVAAFEQLCQAVAYAHAHGVIHRDLKPQNVMVGAFGEVQVMDWGLAKVRPTAPNHADDWNGQDTAPLMEISSNRDSDGVLTQPGSAIGTPAYMPPEQALGALSQIDSRSDVFGLGGILAMILTGKPPFFSDTEPTTHLKSASGDLAGCLANLDQCGAEPELIDLCKRCLSIKQEDRPQNAEAVAKIVAQFRADSEERAKTARIEQARVETQAAVRTAEQRKRRGILMGLAGAFVLLMLTLGGFAWYADRLRTQEQNRLARNNEAITVLLNQAELALGDNDGDAPKAKLALEGAEKRAVEGCDPELLTRLERLQTDWRLLQELNALDRYRWTPQTTLLRYPNREDVVAAGQKVLTKFGLATDSAEPKEVAERAQASTVMRRVIPLYDLEFASTKSVNTLQILDRIDPDQFRTQIRRALATDDAITLLELLDVPDSAIQPPRYLLTLFDDERRIPAESFRSLLLNAVQKHPSHFELLLKLSLTAPPGPKSTTERVRWAQAAVAVAPNNLIGHTILGMSLQLNQDLDGAVHSFRTAVALEPDFLLTYSLLTYVLHEQGNLTEAIENCKKALQLAPNDSTTHLKLGGIYRERGDFELAIHHLQRVSDKNRNQSVSATFTLGQIHYTTGERLLAQQAFEKVLTFPPTSKFAYYCLESSLMLGQIHHENGDYVQALRNYEVATRHGPQSYLAWERLAWLCATGPVEVRDSQKARTAATKACELTKWQNPAALQTLAAAHAESSDFTKAIELQNQALSHLTENLTAFEDAKAVLRLYQSAKPLRSAPPVWRELAPRPRQSKTRSSSS
jgi:eukaryotic-like serine/threonine-protein kinase